MKTKLFVVLGVAAFLAAIHITLKEERGVGLVGTAEAATPKTHAVEHISPEKFFNLIVGAPVGTCSVDFPALDPRGLGLKAACAESATCTAVGVNGAPGAIIGDACIASTSMGSDAGSALILEAVLSCRAVTDGVVFKLCVPGMTDGGTYDPGAAWFTGRIIK